jgi:hypothetical protein
VQWLANTKGDTCDTALLSRRRRAPGCYRRAELLRARNARIGQHQRPFSAFFDDVDERLVMALSRPAGQQCRGGASLPPATPSRPCVPSLGTRYASSWIVTPGTATLAISQRHRLTSACHFTEQPEHLFGPEITPPLSCRPPTGAISPATDTEAISPAFRQMATIA